MDTIQHHRNEYEQTLERQDRDREQVGLQEAAHGAHLHEEYDMTLEEWQALKLRATLRAWYRHYQRQMSFRARHARHFVNEPPNYAWNHNQEHLRNMSNEGWFDTVEQAGTVFYRLSGKALQLIQYQTFTVLPIGDTEKDAA